jgi:PIN domain nuclease of toxin-antitoxin system
VKVLLDSHVFLWWVSDGGRQLTAKVVDLIEDPATEVYVSAVTGFEVASKAARGRLQIPAPADTYVPSRMQRHGFIGLPIDLPHALRAGALPLIHRDPWDRLLVAQAQIEAMPIVTADPVIGQYDVDVVW